MDPISLHASGSCPLPSLSAEIGQPAQNTSSTQAKVHGRIKHLLYYLNILRNILSVFHKNAFLSKTIQVIQTGKGENICWDL